MSFRYPLGWLLLTLVVSLTGCGGDGPDIDVPGNLAPVSGIVKLDGQPLEGALVVFVPGDGAAETRSARGVTDATGKYELNWAPEVKGAIPGQHIVSISKMGPDELEVLPAMYNGSTTLSAEVQEGENDIPFDLKSAK